MNGMLRIGAGVMAKIIDFAFSGYGLVCDVVFLRIIVQHISYRYMLCRNLWVQSPIRSMLADLMQKLAGKFRELAHLPGKDVWDFRHR